MPEVIFNGSDGRLEGRYVHGEGPTPPLAMILHPHPLHGGTMNNRIVYSMFHMFARRGYSVLRFNFRGVGRSQGVFDHGQGELRDAAAALDWMQHHNPNSSGCWVAGFSFGAWIVGFMCASLPANMYDFSFLAPCPASGLIVHGEKDVVSPPDSVVKLVNKLSQQRGITIDYSCLEHADHYFTDHHEELDEICEAYLNKRLKPVERPLALAR
jgi:uncharacterized protein